MIAGKPHAWFTRPRAALSPQRLTVTPLCLTLAALTLPGCGPKSVKPGINNAYKNVTDVSVWTKRFEVESREVFRERARIIKALHLSPGMDVADIGSGTGLFVEPLSRAVGDTGTLYAVDVTKKFIEHLDQRIAEADLKNVKAVWCKEDSVSLPPHSIDFAFICDTYHHFEYPAPTIGSLYRALRPGGEIVIIDFYRIPGVSREWILGHIRANKQTVIKELSRFGFEMVENQPADDFLKENYIIRVRKTGS